MFLGTNKALNWNSLYRVIGIRFVLLYPDGDDSVHVGARYGADICTRGKDDFPRKGLLCHLRVVQRAIALFCRTTCRDDHHVVPDRDVDILFLDSWRIDVYRETAVLLAYVHQPIARLVHGLAVASRVVLHQILSDLAQRLKLATHRVLL